MKFEIYEKEVECSFDLVYRSEEYSFDVEPSQKPGTYSLMIKDLFLELDESCSLMYTWGLCPLDNVNETQIYPKNILDCSLRISECKNLIPGVPFRVNESKKWSVYFNPTKGWVCVGNPVDTVSFFRFAPDSILALDKKQIVALWLFPRLQL